MSDHLEQIRSAIVHGRHEEIDGLARQAIDNRIGPGEIINEGMIAGMDVVGRRFAEGEIFVPGFFYEGILRCGAVAPDASLWLL